MRPRAGDRRPAKRHRPGLAGRAATPPPPDRGAGGHQARGDGGGAGGDRGGRDRRGTLAGVGGAGPRWCGRPGRFVRAGASGSRKCRAKWRRRAVISDAGTKPAVKSSPALFQTRQLHCPDYPHQVGVKLELYVIGSGAVSRLGIAGTGWPERAAVRHDRKDVCAWGVCAMRKPAGDAGWVGEGHDVGQETLQAVQRLPAAGEGSRWVKPRWLGPVAAVRPRSARHCLQRSSTRSGAVFIAAARHTPQRVSTASR